MKKRAMKKYIPKNTYYCYKFLGTLPNKFGYRTRGCKWHTEKFDKELNCEQEYCKYLNRFLDIQDWCKDCEVS